MYIFKYIIPEKPFVCPFACFGIAKSQQCLHKSKQDLKTVSWWIIVLFSHTSYKSDCSLTQMHKRAINCQECLLHQQHNLLLNTNNIVLRINPAISHFSVILTGFENDQIVKLSLIHFTAPANSYTHELHTYVLCHYQPWLIGLLFQSNFFQPFKVIFDTMGPLEDTIWKEWA